MVTSCSAGQVTRRNVLRGTAVAAVGVVLSACSNGAGSAGPSPSASGSKSSSSTSAKRGSVSSPLKPPGTYQQSPQLDQLVKSGSLPKIQDRLPEHPYVVPHRWLTKGNYGGTMTIDITSTVGGDIGEWFCDAAPLRFLNDGLDIGPGLFERWTANADASEWTYYLRKGLRWSDGQPVTTADIMFWWNDMANDPAYTAQSVGSTFKSAKGNICKFIASDDITLKLVYDTPAPLLDLSMASGTYARHDGRFIVPSHFVKQYHPRYNKSVPKSWASVGGLWELKCDPNRNPACPTLFSFKLAQYTEGRSLVWERNPYCYAVMPNGDQLPYLDKFVMTQVGDPGVTTLQISTGRVDYSHGPFNNITLADVSLLTKNSAKYGFDVLFWDSGSGTASMFFFNQDYYQANYRKLFRTPKFLQAMSLAFDRPTARKSIYFNTGDVTTGTMSPKSGEFTPDGGKTVFEAWRDSYVQYLPAKAKTMLDQLGVVDKTGDGWRDFPDGKSLRIRIDVQADRNGETIAKDNLLVANWQAIGIHAVVNPVPPGGFDTYWRAGQYMGHSNWEVGDGPSIVTGPWWVVPIEPARWAPLQGQMYSSKGTPQYTSESNVDPWKRKPPRIMPEKGGPVEKLWELFAKALVEPDAVKRNKVVWDMLKVHMSDGPFFMGTVANYPQVEVKNTDLNNVPLREELALNGYVNTWALPVPAVYDPECYYWGSPQKHQG